jgi:peptide/nickel transport system permease protein
VTKYIAQRLVLSIPTLLGLTIFIFFLFRVLVPVDVVDIASAETETDDPELEQRLREEFGLTGPLPVQYVNWLGNILTGDTGTSFFTRRSVTEEMVMRIPVSLELGMGALLISIVLSVPIGLMSAAKQDSLPDYVARGGAIMFYALPGFWIATLVLVYGSKWFQWAPQIEYEHLWVDPVANVKQLIIPMLILGLSPIGVQIRLVRTQVLEVIRQDYVRTAHAKGLSTTTIYFRHILRNALLPFVTVLGLALPGVVGGTVIFEQIFVIPGVGLYLLESLNRLDLYVIMATNLFFGGLLVLSNIAVDVSYAFIDPRIRLAGR